MDLLCRSVNSALFLSNGLRRDTQLWMVLRGAPGPDVTLRFDGRRARYLNPDERSTGALVRHALIKLEESELQAHKDVAAGGDEAGAIPEDGTLRKGGTPEEDDTEPGAGSGSDPNPDPTVGELERTPGVFVSRAGLAEALARLAESGARLLVPEENATQAARVLEDMSVALENREPELGEAAPTPGDDDLALPDARKVGGDNLAGGSGEGEAIEAIEATQTIETIDAPDDPAPKWAFVLGDDRDLNDKEMALVDTHDVARAGLGARSLLTSHCIVLLHAILDELATQGRG